MSPEQEHHTYPAPERVCEMALKLTNQQEAPASNWLTRRYNDDRISVTTNPNRRPNITIEIFQDPNTPITVFTAHHNEPGYPSRYNPGRWTGYLHQLVLQHTEPDEERFRPIDDSAIFPE